MSPATANETDPARLQGVDPGEDSGWDQQLRGRVAEDGGDGRAGSGQERARGDDDDRGGPGDRPPSKA